MSTPATATVKGGFWPANDTATMTGVSAKNALERTAAIALATKGQRSLRARAIALNGVVAGSNATKTNTRVEANIELGGKRTIETETLVNRNTTAADVTEITADIYSLTNKTTFGANPPVNKDGNPLGTR